MADAAVRADVAHASDVCRSMTSSRSGFGLARQRGGAEPGRLSSRQTSMTVPGHKHNLCPSRRFSRDWSSPAARI